MRWTPSIVPGGLGQTIFLVVDRLSRDDIILHEQNIDDAGLETVIEDLLSGQYDDPLQVLSFNTDENWARDVSEDVASEIQKRCDLQFNDVPSQLEDFVNRHLGRRERQLTLRLA